MSNRKMLSSEKTLTNLGPGVGELIDLNRLPSVNSFNRLRELFEEPTEYLQLLPDIRDIRLPSSSFQRGLQREFAELLHWTAQRLLSAENNISTVSKLPTTENSIVLCLIPSHGICVHLLRRAIPFAILGYRVFLGFSERTMKEGQRVASALFQLLQLTDYLDARIDTGPKQLKFLSGNSDLRIIFTGSMKHYEQIKQSCDAPIIGATGRCVVVIGDSELDAKTMYAQIKPTSFPRSCTRVMVVLYKRKDKFYYLGSMQAALPISQLLGRMHPTFVYTNVKQLADHIEGYKVYHTDTDAALPNLRGIAADPTAGWPGDYYI